MDIKNLVRWAKAQIALDEYVIQTESSAYGFEHHNMGHQKIHTAVVHPPLKPLMGRYPHGEDGYRNARHSVGQRTKRGTVNRHDQNEGQ